MTTFPCGVILLLWVRRVSASAQCEIHASKPNLNGQTLDHNQHFMLVSLLLTSLRDERKQTPLRLITATHLVQVICGPYVLRSKSPQVRQRQLLAAP